MKRKILVTAIGGDIGSAVVRCLKEEFPEDIIIGCDISRYNQGRDYVDKFFIAPPYSEVKKYCTFIENVCNEENITHFIPITEPEILILDGNRDFFNKYNIKLAINNSFLLDIAMNKYKTATYLLNNNILTPKSWRPSELDKQFLYPVIVKGEQGCGSKNVRVVNNQGEYIEALKSIKNPFIQEYVGNEYEEYTVGIFSDGTVVKSIAFKRKLGYGGMSIHVESVNDEKLNSIAIKTAHLLKLVGCMNIQLRKQNDNYYIFEINPRISSTVGFRHKIGFKDVIWWIRLLDNELGDIRNVKIQENIIGIRTLDEKIYVKE